MIAPAMVSASELARTDQVRRGVVAGLLSALAIAFGIACGVLTVHGSGYLAVLGAGIFLPILFWKLPVSAIVAFLVGATAVDRFPDLASDNFLAKIPLWRSLAQDYGISGAILFPIEMLMLLALVIWLAKAISGRQLRLRLSQLAVAIALTVLVAIVAEAQGLAKGGIFNISLWEFRPFVYLGVTYLLASQLVTKRGDLDALLWGIVLGTIYKGLLGTERVITLANVFPKPEAILEHDESFFFSVYVLLTVGMWVFGKKGKLRWVATLFLPFVFTAQLGNNRRAAWVIMPAALLALGIIMYVRTPAKRKLIGAVMTVLLVLSAAYVAVFRNSQSLIAEPAHAVWSQFQPDPRDASSNLYRILENANLAIDIKAAVATGTGFGVPVAHPIPLSFDASSFDPLINFIPHNNILYVWLRLGTAGVIVFWCMIGAAIVSACRLARYKYPDLGLFGVLALVCVMAWLVQGWLDVGIVSFRIVVMVGSVLGALTAAHRIAAELPVVEEPAESGHDDTRVPLTVLPLEPARRPAAAAAASAPLLPAPSPTGLARRPT